MFDRHQLPPKQEHVLVVGPDILQSSRSHVKVHITQASLDNELEDLQPIQTSCRPNNLAISSSLSMPQQAPDNTLVAIGDVSVLEQCTASTNVSANATVNSRYTRRHSMPAYALDKVKSMLHNKNTSSNSPSIDEGNRIESIISRRKKSLLGLFNTIGTNLGLVSPKRSLSNGGNGGGGSWSGSIGSVDLMRLRHSLGVLGDPFSSGCGGGAAGITGAGSRDGGCLLGSASAGIGGAVVAGPLGAGGAGSGHHIHLLTSVDEVYYRPHRSLLRDLMCCVCFKKHDEYDNLIESHGCARIFTVLVLLTIVCMLIGYIVKAATEKRR